MRWSGDRGSGVVVVVAVVLISVGDIDNETVLSMNSAVEHPTVYGSL